MHEVHFFHRTLLFVRATWTPVFIMPAKRVSRCYCCYCCPSLPLFAVKLFFLDIQEIITKLTKRLALHAYTQILSLVVCNTYGKIADEISFVWSKMKELMNVYVYLMKEGGGVWEEN